MLFLFTLSLYFGENLHFTDFTTILISTQKMKSSTQKKYWCNPACQKCRQQQYKTKESATEHTSHKLIELSKTRLDFWAKSILDQLPFLCNLWFQLFIEEWPYARVPRVHRVAVWVTARCFRSFTPCSVDARYPKPVVNISCVWMHVIGISTSDTSVCPLCPSSFTLFTFPSPSADHPLLGLNQTAALCH